MLHYEFEDGSFVAVRPSGTEPKCKFYYCICAENEESALSKLESLKLFLEAEIFMR